MMNYREHLVDNLAAAWRLLVLAAAHAAHGIVRCRWTAAFLEWCHAALEEE
jgi:hypothetical protein